MRTTGTALLRLAAGSSMSLAEYRDAFAAGCNTQRTRPCFWNAANIGGN